MNSRISSTIPVVLIAIIWSGSSAVAGDYGISFHYSRHTPRCTAVSYASPYYSESCVYYDDFDGYIDPVVYSRATTPDFIGRRDCYPASYHTTYTRSKCYTRPVKRVHASVRFSGGHRTRHYRTRDSGVRRTYSHYSTPSYRRYSYRAPTNRYSARRVECRPSVRVSTSRHGSSYHRSHGGRYIRDSYRPHRSYRGHGRSSYHRSSGGPRVRIIRR